MNEKIRWPRTNAPKRVPQDRAVGLIDWNARPAHAKASIRAGPLQTRHKAVVDVTLCSDDEGPLRWGAIAYRDRLLVFSFVVALWNARPATPKMSTHAKVYGLHRKTSPPREP